MSNENENERQNEQIPGSSKDTNIERNKKTNDGVKRNDFNQSENDEKENYDSLTDLPIYRQTSRIKKVEAFVYMRIPPDSGYAWIVLITGFLSIVSIDGMRLTIGRVMPFICADIDSNGEKEALIASLQIGFFYLCGPFACALIHKFSYRIVCMLGACLVIFGTLSGSFSVNYVSLIILYGVITGTGYGMVSLSTQIMIGFYFEKYRPIATGICSSGSGFGLLIFSPLYNFITINYGWRTVLLWQSFFGFIVFILSISYREVKPTKIGRYVEKNSERDSDTYVSTDSVEISSAHFQNSLISNSNLSYQSERLKEKSNLLLSNVQSQNIIQKSSMKVKPTNNKYLKFLPKCCKRKPRITDNDKTDNKEMAIHIEINPMDRQDIFYHGKPVYGQDVPKYNDQMTLLSKPIETVKSVHYTMSVTKTLRKDKSKKGFPFGLCKMFTSTIKLMIDPVLLKIREFQLLLTASFLYALGSNVPYLYLNELVEIPKSYANYLLSALGVANLIFRIAGGFLAYSTTTNPLYIAGIPMAIGGILTIFSGFYWANIIWYQFFYCIILGMGYALSTSYRSIIVVKLLGLQNLTNAFGLHSLGMGIASFGGSYFAGFIISVSGKTNYSFVYAGIVLFLGGGIFVLLPHLIKKPSATK